MNIVTITDNNYAIGVYALLRSLLKNSGLKDFNFYVGVYDSLSDEWRQKINGQKVTTFFNLKDLDIFETKGKILKPQLVPSMQKMVLFRRNEYYGGECLFLDADVICLSDIQASQDFYHFSAVPDISTYIQPAVNNRFYFNGGVYVFAPDDVLYEELKNYAMTSDMDYKYGDNTLLVEYFYHKRPNEVTLLDYRWNMLTSIKGGLKKGWKPEEAKLLHYAGRRKPWDREFGDDQQRRIWKKFI